MLSFLAYLLGAVIAFSLFESLAQMYAYQDSRAAKVAHAVAVFLVVFGVVASLGAVYHLILAIAAVIA